MNWKELQKQIKDNSLILSYSSLKEFMVTPAAFVNYKLNPKQPTKDMQFGKLVDCIILTPEKVKKDYVFGLEIPSSNLQIELCNKILEDFKKNEWQQFSEKRYLDSFDRLFDSVYGNSPSYNFYSKFGPYLKARNKGKEVASSEDYANAVYLKEIAYANPASKRLLESLTQTQRKLEWEYAGLKFHGFSDGDNDDLFMDIKITDAEPGKLRNQVIKMKWFIQIGMYYYAYAAMGRPRKQAKILALSQTGDVSVHKVSQEYIDAGVRIYMNYVADFKRCIIQNKFKSNYDFYGPDNGEYILELPPWLKT